MKPLLLLLSLSFLFSCQNNNDGKSYEALSDSTSLYGLGTDSVKLVKTAGALFKVNNVEQSVRAVAALAKGQGGQVYEQVFESAETARKELKISADSLQVVSTIQPQANLVVLAAKKKRKGKEEK